MERWVIIENGKYKVSSLGRVVSIRKSRSMILRPSFDGRYYRVNISGRDIKVHRLVATTFIPNPGNNLQVNHINGDKGDNRVDNLEWCNASYNQRHAHSIGLNRKDGIHNPRSKLTESMVSTIKREVSLGIKQVVLARQYGISNSTINAIIKGRKWKNVK